MRLGSNHIVAAAIAALTWSSFVRAQSFNIDFGDDHLGLPDTYAAAGGQPGDWEEIIALGTTAGLRDITNTVTDVSLHLSAFTISGQAGGPATNDDQVLLHDNFYSRLNDTWQVLFTGLLPGMYDVYYYAPSNGCVFTGDFSFNGVPFDSLAGAAPGELIQGISWDVREVVVGADGILDTGRQTVDGPFIEFEGLAGLQLVAVPAPATLALPLIAGLIGLARPRTPRRSRLD